MSFRGIRFRYFAVVIALIAIAAGVYTTFFHSQGFIKATATIVALDELPRDFPEEDTQYEVTVQYTADGQQYTNKLDYYSPSFKVGKTIPILYDPANPSVVHAQSGFGIYLLAVGAVVLAVAVFSIVKGRRSLEEIKEDYAVGKEARYAAPLAGEERELYFLTDLGTPKYGHRMEDADRNVLIEAKMTKFNLLSPFGFQFINHVSGKSTPHLVGHEETSEWGTLLLENHYTFTLDGEDIWKHLKRNGIRVDSRFGGGSGKLVGVNYDIYRDDALLAHVESTSKHVHEEDAEAHSRLGNLVPIKGFYRVWTKEQNLDLLFVTLLAFARTDASADTGGTYKTLFNTLKK